MKDTRPIVLIVDDQPLNLKLLAETLNRDFAVKVATNGPDALALARRPPYPAVILLDVVMPQMDGYAVCTALKEDPVTASIPVIFISALTDGECEPQALACGAVDFIHKPINPVVVRLRVELQVRLRQRERALWESKQQLEMALEAGSMGIWIYEVAGERLTWTDRHSTLLGLPESERGATLRDVRNLVHPRDRRPCLRGLHRTLAGAVPFDEVYRIIWPDGSLHWMHSLGKLLRDDWGESQRIIGTTRDITTLKEHQRQLERMAHYDALTSVPNRLLFSERLRRAMARAKRNQERLAVVYLDLDGFKEVNDAHGHAVGDQLLIGVAKRLQQRLREADTLARLGGDEFALLLSDLTDDDACRSLIARLLTAVCEPLEVGNLTLQVTASLGITFYPQEAEIDGDQLLRQADQAMYRAKQTGKNRYQVTAWSGCLNAGS